MARRKPNEKPCKLCGYDTPKKIDVGRGRKKRFSFVCDECQIIIYHIVNSRTLLDK